jgi:hypothetical protein
MVEPPMSGHRSGIQIDVRIGASGNSNCAGMIPTTVCLMPLRVICDPTSAGSAPKRRRHRPHRDDDGRRAGSASASWNPRPAGVAPNVEQVRRDASAAQSLGIADVAEIAIDRLVRSDVVEGAPLLAPLQDGGGAPARRVHSPLAVYVSYSLTSRTGRVAGVSEAARPDDRKDRGVGADAERQRGSRSSSWRARDQRAPHEANIENNESMARAVE